MARSGKKNKEASIEPIKVNDTKEVIEKKLEVQAKELQRVFAQDAFVNQMARLGYGQDNLNEGADYELINMGYMFPLFTAMYRGSWIARKIVDVIPSDMLKNWIKFDTSLDGAKIKQVEKVLRTTKTRAKLKQGLQWGRLYGGAIALMLIDGDEDFLDTPLNYDYILPSTYKGLLILDRWSGVFPDATLVSDINDQDFGLPEYYIVNIGNTQMNSDMNASAEMSLKVHHSRVLRFTGRELPHYEKIKDMYWGESELEVVYEELKKRDNTSANIASLVFLSNTRVLKMADLGSLMSSSSEKAMTNLYNVLEAQNKLMSNMGIYVMDREDEYTTHQYTFSGLSEIYESFMLDIAGASEMPVSKLFGRNPAGFNATGEGDLKQYYETITEKQESQLTPILDKLFPVVFMSELGGIPDDLDWAYNPVMQMDNKDLVELAKSFAEAVLQAFDAGLIDKTIALKELKQNSQMSGMWSNITDEYILKVEEEDKIREEEEAKMQAELASNEDPDEVNTESNTETREDIKNTVDAEIEGTPWYRAFRKALAVLEGGNRID